MADSYTTNLNLTKPEVGASADSWGSKINGDMDSVDSVFNAGGNGTSVGLNVGSGKTLNVVGSVTGGVIATVTGTQTLTGKTISGADNTLTNLPLANTTGTLAVSKGGTGLTSAPTSGQLLIGNGTGYSLATLTAGTNVTITNSAGGITINSTASGGAGTITSVTGSGTVNGITLSSSTTSGAATLTLGGAVTAPAGTLTGTTLNSTVTGSSLTSVGTLSSLSVSGTSTLSGAATFSSTATHSGNVTINSGSGLYMQTSSASPGYANSTIGGAWTTDASNGPGMFISRANFVNLVLNNNSGGDVVACYKSGTSVGGISVSASATSFNTSSDYRLKENFEPLTGALSRLQNLSVYRFNWKNDPAGAKVDGFIAHEVTPVVPEAIHGAKDAVYEDGSIKAQGIDQSKLVPLLTAALQEAIAEINSLKSRVTALEAA